jgi:acyl carrier protein
MKKDYPAYALLFVQITLGRYLAIPASEVRPRQRLAEDLGLDAFDVALVALAIGDRLAIDVSLERVDDTATVEALAAYVGRALATRYDDGDEEMPTSHRERSSTPGLHA